MTFEPKRTVKIKPPTLPDLAPAGITYLFQDTLAAEEKRQGVPDLIPTNPLGRNGFRTANVFGNTQRVYHFAGSASPTDQQAGLTFDNRRRLLDPNNYSIELVFVFEQLDNQWRRIVDVEDRQSDNGFYADPQNHLQIYPYPGTGKLVTAGVYRHVVLTNSKAGTVAAYMDGGLQFTASTDIMNIKNPRQVVHFFLDNVVGPGQGEFSDGSIALLRLYNHVITADQVSRLAAAFRGNKPEAQTAHLPMIITPDPGTLAAIEAPVGKTYFFRVIGSTAGSVWGTDVYTADSTLAAAAVHAGILKPDEEGIVRVQMLPGQGAYAGSTRNGVTTGGWGAFTASYRVSRAAAGR